MALNRPVPTNAFWEVTPHCNMISGYNFRVSNYTMSQKTLALSLGLLNDALNTSDWEREQWMNWIKCERNQSKIQCSQLLY